MTRIGLIADIHSEEYNLKRVIDYFQEEHIDNIFCAGDVVGYNYHPNEVISLCKEYNIQSVLGNHDNAVLTGDTEGFTPRARGQIEYTANVLTNESYNFLYELPLCIDEVIDGKRIYIVHGSPYRPLMEYVYVQDIKNTFLDYFRGNNPDLLVMGHTHIPMVAHIKDTVIVNPGSVSESRTVPPVISLSIYDTETNKVKTKLFSH